MSDTPIALLALLFLLVAVWEWRRGLLLSRVSLGVATVFVLAALQYPGASAAEVAEHTEDGLAWLVIAARGAGLAVVLATVAGFLRELQAGR